MPRLAQAWARRPALAALGAFWVVVLAGLGVGAGTLQWLGPPPAIASVAAQVAERTAEAIPAIPAADPFAIAAPDSALLEPTPGDPAALLPRIGPDGRTPMRQYARAFDQSDTRPRIGLLFVGFGMTESDSRAALDSLPGGVTVAFSPYAPVSLPLLAQARARGHEYLVSIPMESSGYPLDDAGSQSLLTGADPRETAKRLAWSLGRFTGYVGATGALGELRGERFAAAAGVFGSFLSDIQARGLLYIDPRPDAPPHAGSRAADVIVDDPATRLDIDAKLGRLEAIASKNGSALGLAGPLRPVTVDRVAAWARGLDARGFALAPVSELARMQGR